VYDPTTLGDFLYFPITLLVYTPFTLIERACRHHRIGARGGVLHLGVYQACALVVVRELEVDRRAGARGRGPAGQYPSGVVQLQRCAGAGADDCGDDGGLRRHHRLALARGWAGAEQA
jgi:hypothetical protein